MVQKFTVTALRSAGGMEKRSGAKQHAQTKTNANEFDVFHDFRFSIFGFLNRWAEARVDN